ncbi:MAG: TVP38/TMEM64 family protein [Candidatus Binataceae bacterium]
MPQAEPVQAPGDRPPLRRPILGNVIRIAMLAVLALGSLWLIVAHPEWFRNPAELRSQIMAWGLWAPIVFIALYAVGPSFLLPGAIMTIAGGLAFGVIRGTLYSFVGANLGAIVAFGAGRFLGKGFVQRIVGDRFQSTVERIARHGFRIIFYLRIVPVIPYNALNLLAGASPITFYDFFWASIIGMVPGTFVFAFLGDALWNPLSLRFLSALLMLGACVGLGELIRRWSALKIEP